MPRMLPWPRMLPVVRLSGADFSGQIRREGVQTTIRRAAACPCADPQTRRPDPNHVACAGWGWQYPPELKIELAVQWTEPSAKEEDGRQGRTQPGDYTVTWSGQPLGEGDIFIHPVDEAVTDDHLERGHVDPEGESLERLRFRAVTVIEDLRDRVRAYQEGVDFQLGADKRAIEWLPGGLAPDAGALYTVRYRYRAEYVIAGDLPKARHDGTQRLPYKAQVVRYDPNVRQQGQDLGP